MMHRAEWHRGVPVLVTLGLCAVLIWWFHARFWWPVDEGVYAYVAQRINAGDVLHRDLIDLHAGYINFVNAGALRIFGEDLISLRYPLAGLTMIQAVLAVLLLMPRGVWVAATGALVVTAVSFIQFLNPSANWYALFIAFLACWCLTRVDGTRGRDALLIGFLIGLCFLFRQLSGVFLAIGVLTWLVADLGRRAPGRSRLARGLIAVMALGLAGYLWSKASFVGFVLIGFWPLALLAAMWRQARAADAAVAKLVLWLAVGALLSAAPLAIFHIVQGTLGPWLTDSLFTALLIHEQDFIARSSFLYIAIGALNGLSQWRQPEVILNGLLWLTLLAAPALLGAIILRAALKHNVSAFAHPLPVVALFFCPVALHFQIPIYLWFGIAPVLLALLWVAGGAKPRSASVLLLSLATAAIIYQAGQPLSRGLGGIVRGERITLGAADGLPRSSLRIEGSDRDIYRAVIARIDSVASPDEPLFTLPMDPEFNFLTGRRAPVPYFGTPLGLRTADDVEETLQRLDQAAPLFVIHRREDKYLTPLSGELLREIRRRDSSPETFGPFDLYRLSARAAADSVPPDRE